MKTEQIIVRGLEICGGLFMGIIAVITVIVFSPYLVPKAILDYFRDKENRRNFFEASALILIAVFALVFLSLISQP